LWGKADVFGTCLPSDFDPFRTSARHFPWFPWFQAEPALATLSHKGEAVCRQIGDGVPLLRAKAKGLTLLAGFQVVAALVGYLFRCSLALFASTAHAATSASPIRESLSATLPTPSSRCNSADDNLAIHAAKSKSGHAHV
jgi:hypothetical protein